MTALVAGRMNVNTAAVVFLSRSNGIGSMSSSEITIVPPYLPSGRQKDRKYLPRRVLATILLGPFETVYIVAGIVIIAGE